MAEGHYCKIHDTVFFKSGRMRGYAHPIGEKNEDGKYPEGWCNEDAQEVANLPAQPKDNVLPEYKKVIDKAVKEGNAEPPKPKKEYAPQEIGMWLKELGNRIGDGTLEKDYPQSHTKIKAQYYDKMWKVTGISP